MAIPSRQIGWGTESNLLWQILKQLNKLTSIMFGLKPKYKVYTALLTQSGATSPVTKNSGTLDIGVTYEIIYNSLGMDFTNVGAPNNEVGTFFVATGTTPTSWGADVSAVEILAWNEGAPVAIVLENTIGDVWFTYSDVGIYKLNNETLTDLNKLYLNITQKITRSFGINWNDEDGSGAFILTSSLQAGEWDSANDMLLYTPIEIKVYN